MGRSLCVFRALRQDRTASPYGQLQEAGSCNATGDLIGEGMPDTTAAEHLNFIRGLLARPKNVGAIAPSSPALAKAIAAQVDPTRRGPVLELGPGTGIVTEALIERGVAEERIIAIEYEREFTEVVSK